VSELRKHNAVVARKVWGRKEVTNLPDAMNAWAKQETVKVYGLSKYLADVMNVEGESE
jgi:hypothetical protein